MRFIELHRLTANGAAGEPFLVNMDKVSLVNGNQIVTDSPTPIFVQESYEDIKGIIRAMSEMECRYDDYFKKVGGQ